MTALTAVDRITSPLAAANAKRITCATLTILLEFLPLEETAMHSIVSRFTRLGLALGLALSLTSAFAATFTIDSGSILLFRSIQGGVELDDVRGAASIGIANPGPIGTLLFADSTGGTDPNFLVLAFGNSALNGFNGTFTELAGFLVDFPTLAASGAGVTVTANLIGVIPDPLTDPALSGLASIGSIVLGFDLVQSIPAGGSDGFFAYSLTSVSSAAAAVPEPSSVLLGGMGLVALLIARRRSRT